jgi:hypothetical protein
MTSHELAYIKYLVRRIKDLYIEKEAMSVLLDMRICSDGERAEKPWREAVRLKQHDEVYCSAVEANLAPHFSRIERALLDEDLFQELRSRL